MHGSLFYCVANMPGAVPYTSTYALTNVTLPYALALAEKGWRQAMRDDPSLALGLNTHAGAITNAGVAEAHGRPVTSRVRGAQRRRSGDQPEVTGHDALTAAVRGYLDHLLVERGLAANTLAAYRADLSRYLGHLAGLGRSDPADVTTADVTGFLASLRAPDADGEPELSASSAARTLVAVRGLHAFWLRDGVTTTDPAAEVKPPSLPSRLPKALPVGDVERMILAAGARG